ncbi:MAG: TonB-dependent receptor [Muribaculaceae bacterium]|nr:TonB-dependent receptor [Muribaculaceae bacterium]
MKRLLSLMAIMTVMVMSALGQRTVSGHVISGDDNQPIIGATVLVKGTNQGTSTDLDGNFVLKDVPSSANTLVVSYVGMVTEDVTIADNLVIKLWNSTNKLDELVVVGYGTTTRAAFTGAASVMDGDVVERKNDANFVKSLEGNVTGIQYNNSTSMPGQYGSIYIRGMGSLSSSSQPLYVIDGMPVNSDYDGMSSTSNNYFDPMAAYNPNDIESITVLKDASATAIYGSRAANGVIIVNTKKGKAGKLNVTLDVKQGFSKVANNNMKFANAKQSLDLFAKGLAARYPSNYDYDYAYEYLKDAYFEWDGVTDTDWMDVISRNAYYQEYNASVAGATGDTHYYFSLGYLDTDGIIVGSDNQRYSGRVNLDTKYQWLTGGINAQYSYNKNNSFSQSTAGSMSAPVTAAMSSMTPFDPVYMDDGTEYNPGATGYNPLALQDPKLGDLSQVTNQTINANPWLQVNLPYGIYVKTNFGVNVMNQRQYDYWSAVYNPQGMDYNGLGQQYNSNTSTLTWTNLIGWNYTFNEKNVFDVMIAQEMQRYEYRYEYYSKYDFPFATDGMRNMATAGADNGAEYYEASSRLASYFGSANYSYDSRYYLSASFRRDGSSVFGRNKRWGNFWSVGAKWRLGQEAFMKNQDVVKNADIRITYGTVGNQSLPSLYAARGFYSAGYNYNQTPGMVPAGIENPDLTWETSRKFDVGFDLNLWNRLNVTFDYYNEDTSDALYQVPLSFTTGMDVTWQNIGKIRNRGIELGLRGVVFANKNMSVSLFGNLTYNKNKVLKLANGSIEGTYQIIEEGRPYRQFKMKEYAGVDAETGKALYYLNEEGDETTDSWQAAAKRYVGSAEPKFVGAFGLNADGYGFDVSLTFNYRTGGKVYDSGHNFTGWGMSFRTPLECVALDSWTPENKSAKYPQYIYGDPNFSSSQASSRFLMSGNFLRLSNITVGYTLPQKITRKALMDKVRFYINMDNVHTWTASDFIGYNPETYSSGVIAWQYPAVFSFSGGVQIVF